MTSGDLWQPSRWPLDSRFVHRQECGAASNYTYCDCGAMEAVAKVWEEAVQAVAWAMDNGPIESALHYVADHNPYRPTT